MTETYLIIGFIVFWVIVCAVSIGLLILLAFLLNSARLWVVSTDVYHYWVAGKSMDTEDIRNVYAKYSGIMSNAAKMYALLYRLRNIRRCRTKR